MAIDQEVAPHLGGHEGMTWIDRATLAYLVERYGIESMLDVGCGPGGMIEVAHMMGLTVVGVDGDPHMERPNVQIHDYTEGQLPADGWDLIWCVEFVEHVEAQYIDNFLATFAGGKVLFLTHALPGQGGHHHVNEQFDGYWIDLLASNGWAVDQEATDWVRDNGEIPFAKMSGLVFVRS